MKDSGKIVHLNDAKQQLTLQQLFAEIVALREGNARVIAMVNELLDDKQRLIKKLNRFKLSFTHCRVVFVLVS